MTIYPLPRLLLLEGKQDVADHIRLILVQTGWDVVCETDAEKALNLLKDTAKDPFVLLICSFRHQNREEDALLTRAMALSPMTQRMLLAPADKPEALIEAINRANIHACITYSFKDRHLLDQAGQCLKQFRLLQKQQQLKRVVAHQNRKMYRIARGLKKKKEETRGRISQKKAEIFKRRCARHRGRDRIRTERDATLARRMETHKIAVEPEILAAEMDNLKDYIATLFRHTAKKTGSSGIKTPAAPFPASPCLTALGFRVLKSAYVSAENPSSRTVGAGPGPVDREQAESVKDLIRIEISDDGTKAFIQKRKAPGKTGRLSVQAVLAHLRDHDVTYGLMADGTLALWMEAARPGDEKQAIAKGDPPDPGHGGKITYHFEREYTHPGKIAEDGTIDFRDRGEIPHVAKGQLLAVKTPAREGRAGVDVRGKPIPVAPVPDPPLTPGTGTVLSGDGLSVHAATDGHPHVDTMGVVTVTSDMMINGDVDFKTGNIEFDGNVIVKGMVRNGFKVNCINLTAREIQGGIIDVRGDIWVAGGIMDSRVSARGSVYAKFVNNCQIRSFSDLTVKKEIIDSQVLLSGACMNRNGHIIASSVSARNGIETGFVGTAASKPVWLKVGVTNHADTLIREIDKALERNRTRLKALNREINVVEEKDNILHGTITHKAQIHESALKAIRKIKKRIHRTLQDDPGDRESEMVRIRELTEAAEKAEADLDRVFRRQDRYALEIEALQEQVAEVEKENMAGVLEKKAIREYLRQSRPLATATVHRTITPETTVTGPNTSLTLPSVYTRCRISEETLGEEGFQYQEMQVRPI